MQQAKRVDSLLGRAAVLTSALAVLTLLAVSSFSSDAQADPFRTQVRRFEIPDVANRTEAEAIRTLEALGLTCRREDVASQTIDRVVATVPAAGQWIDRGHEVVVRVGVRIRVQTIVPHVRRKLASEVIASLGDIYAIALNPVRGPAYHEGRVIGQLPRPGAQLPFRGVLTLDVVDNQTTVPLVEGLGLRRALRRLEQAGLRAKALEMPRHDVERPTVIRQRAEAGRRVPYDTEIRLRVAVPARRFDEHGGMGRGRRGRPERVPERVIAMPSVTGMDVGQASRLLERLGLTVQIEGRGRFAAGVVREQTPVAHAAIPAGSLVTLRTSRRRVFGRSDVGR